jgi:hypothetical protein
MMDDIVEYGRTKAAELQAILHPGTTGGGGMTMTGYVASNALGQLMSMVGTGQSQAPLSYSGWSPTTNPFQDFIWRSGSKPVQISPEDTIVGTKGGASKNVSVGDINIRIDKVNSDVDVRRLAIQVRDEVVNSLRTMS